MIFFQDNELMQNHIQEHIAKYFPEEEPVVLEEIVVPEEEPVVEEEDGNILNKILMYFYFCL